MARLKAVPPVLVKVIVLGVLPVPAVWLAKASEVVLSETAGSCGSSSSKVTELAAKLALKPPAATVCGALGSIAPRLAGL